jgi:hypothetical protein
MNSKKSKNILVCLGIIVFAPSLALANAFTPLVGIPGLSATPTMGEFVNALYILAISLAALLAVVKLIIAGTKYMLSDVVTNKQDALNDIQGSLIGLLIVISAVLVLQIINPGLRNLNIFDNIIQASAPPPVSSGPTVYSSGPTTVTGPVNSIVAAQPPPIVVTSNSLQPAVTPDVGNNWLSIPQANRAIANCRNEPIRGIAICTYDSTNEESQFVVLDCGSNNRVKRVDCIAP